jgi:predicted RNA methylase
MDFILNFNQYKLSKQVDDFLIDNINNLSNDKLSIYTNHITDLSNEQYFPFGHNVNFNNLKIDDIGRYSITLPKKADIISKIIKSYCSNLNRDITITDATAGIGGNVLSFSKYNFKVNAIEIDEERFEHLKNNITEYKYSVNLINADYTVIYQDIKQDVIFIDPPWGGVNYKNSEDITLKLGNIKLEDLCNDISDKKLAKITALKLPFNYDLNHIKNNIHLPFTIYKLKYMLLIIILNNM